MNYKEKITSGLKKPKNQVVLSLAIVVAGTLAPDLATSDMGYPGCPSGDAGDCEITTGQSIKICAVGSFWNDCSGSP